MLSTAVMFNDYAFYIFTYLFFKRFNVEKVLLKHILRKITKAEFLFLG